MHSCYSHTGYNWNTVNTQTHTQGFFWSPSTFCYFLCFLITWSSCFIRSVMIGNNSTLCKILCWSERWGLDEGRGRWDARGWHWMGGLNEGRVQGDEQRIERGSMAGISRKVLWKETKGEILRGASPCGFIVSSCNEGGRGSRNRAFWGEELINFYQTVIKLAS